MRPLTLSIDIGGTGLKASVLDSRGRMTGHPSRVSTPARCTPAVLMAALAELILPLPAFDRVSIGFPGVVRDGVVLTAPHFRTYFPPRFPLASALARQWGKPVKLLNDADMQGLAVILGTGLELVVTLGTGMGTALFLDGALLPHLELAQHPSPSGRIYNEYIGDKILKRIGKRAWNTRVKTALEALRTLVNYDRLYVGGGNSRNVTFTLPNMRLVSNRAGLLGGIALWNGQAVTTLPRTGGRRGS
jgi:polyphosphate glucokinase